ncbi:MAG TPA: hypothetical protein PKN99_05625 [Cyclobacteriaceae bacterium]|nr:hypothetical protein [Cyclobacteriaceae bacterium]HNP07082.1 hypothetical protein [Cyclobacteriaceae bacterium]HRK52600.1 hypothetical protein [Cyclobacteriaceae bacterium]
MDYIYKVRHFIIVGLIFILGSNSLCAQPQLALLKKDGIITRFEEGEYIRFQRKGSDDFIRAIITGIHPGYFMLGEDTIYHYEVTKVDIRSKTTTSFKVASIGKALILAGVSLIFIDVFNTVVIQDRSYKVEKGVGSASLALVGVGGLMQIVNNNYFRVGRKRKLASLNLR